MSVRSTFGASDLERFTQRGEPRTACKCWARWSWEELGGCCRWVREEWLSAHPDTWSLQTDIDLKGDVFLTHHDACFRRLGTPSLQLSGTPSPSSPQLDFCAGEEHRDALEKSPRIAGGLAASSL